MTKPKPSSAPDSYKILVRKILKEFEEMDVFLKNRIAQGHWRVGRWVHEHLLNHQEKAKHGTGFYEKLAEDTGRDATTLRRTVQFYLAYPIRANKRELTWDHYKGLITIKDEKERKKLEQKIIENNWGTIKFREYLSVKRKFALPDNDQPIPQLKFTRGKLHTYQIIKANKPLAGKSPFVLDLGFRQEYVTPKDAPQFKEGDFVELLRHSEAEGRRISSNKSLDEILRFAQNDKGEFISAQKNAISQDELFTYKAYVDKIIDGDTLLVSFDFNLDVSISQKLRLRGIDCPEMDTEEGKRAKRFVESRLKPCEFIIVKTYKDRSDKFDRYLADVFYKAGESDPAIVAAEGEFLNQELLDERLAAKYEL